MNYLTTVHETTACKHSSVYTDYGIVGKFRRCTISWKCCIWFRRNVRGFYFRVSRTQQLTTPLSVTLLYWVFTSMKKIDPVANFPQARHFFTKNSGSAIMIPVGSVAFCHCLNRKPWRRFPPFALCIYARCIKCLSCSGASTRRRSTKILKYWWRAIFKF